MSATLAIRVDRVTAASFGAVGLQGLAPGHRFEIVAGSQRDAAGPGAEPAAWRVRSPENTVSEEDRRFVVCLGEIMFITDHFVGLVPYGQSLDRPVAVPKWAIDPRFPEPCADPGSADYGLAIDETWVRRHLGDRRPLTARFPSLTLGVLAAAMSLTWWMLP